MFRLKQTDLLGFILAWLMKMEIFVQTVARFHRVFFKKEYLMSNLSLVFPNTVDSLYLELAMDQRICSRQRVFEIEREKQVTAHTKGPRHQFDIERGSRQRVFEIERVNCMSNLCLLSKYPHILPRNVPVFERFHSIWLV